MTQVAVADAADVPKGLTICTTAEKPELPPPEAIASVVSMYQCVKSVKNPHGLTRTLEHFELLGYCTGNSAVVFEVMTDSGRHLRFKCYTRPKDNLEAIYGDKLLRGELYVFSGESGAWVDVLADEWIDGRTLGEVMQTAAARCDTAQLASLAAGFDDMARGMLAEDWAHGDLKPDNIIVTPDGELRMIDFDAAYIPSLKHSRSRELGTAAWQHPSRGYDDYDRHLDDYPVAMISTLLHALAAEPAIFARYADADGVPLDSRRIAAGRCDALEHIERMFAERCMAVQYRVAQLLHSRAYILPQLAEYLSYEADDSCRCNESGLTMRGGLYGYVAGGRYVIPPLFDDVSVSGGTAEVVLGGVKHRLICDQTECQ